MILSNLEKEKTCFKDLVAKIGEQKIAIENKDEERVLGIVEEKDALIEIFQNIEEEIAVQLKLLSQQDIQGLAQEADALKVSLEKMLETIIRMEEECEKEIGLKMQEVKKRIFELHRGKKIGKGYGGFLKSRPLISRKV